MLLVSLSSFVNQIHSIFGKTIIQIYHPYPCVPPKTLAVSMFLLFGDTIVYTLSSLNNYTCAMITTLEAHLSGTSQLHVKKFFF